MTWDVIFYATADGSVPGADFLDGCPAKVRGTILAVLDAVAAAAASVLRGRQVGGHARRHGRLLRGPAIAVIAGMRKRTGTVFSERDYAKVRRLGSDHIAHTPRRIAS